MVMSNFSTFSCTAPGKSIPSDMEMTLAPLSRAQRIAFSSTSVLPTVAAEHLAREQLRDTASDADPQTVDVPARDRAGAVRAVAVGVVRPGPGEVLLEQGHPGERGMWSGRSRCRARPP